MRTDELALITRAAAESPARPRAELRLVVADQGADEIHAGTGEQVQAVEEFDRQDVARLLAASEHGSIQVFLVGQLG